MRMDALFFWLGTVLLVIGASLAAGVAGYSIALGGAIMLFTLSSRRFKSAKQQDGRQDCTLVH